MKKWTAITDGGKYGVDETGNRYLRTQGLELLPDGEEFDAILVKQVGNIRGLKPLKLEWTDATPEEEWEKLLPEYRRQVLAPLVKDQDEPSVQNDSSPVASHSSASGNSDELINCLAYALRFWEKNPTYRIYYCHGHAANSETPITGGLWGPAEECGYGYFSGAFKGLLDEYEMSLLKKYFNISDWQAVDIHFNYFNEEDKPKPHSPNSEQNVQERDARKADQGTEADKQKDAPDKEGRVGEDMVCPVDEKGLTISYDHQVELMTKISEAVTVIDGTGKVRLNAKKIMDAIAGYQNNVKESDAVGFARWKDRNYKLSDYDGLILYYHKADYMKPLAEVKYHTLAELYKLFTLK